MAGDEEAPSPLGNMLSGAAHMWGNTTKAVAAATDNTVKGTEALGEEIIKFFSPKKEAPADDEKPDLPSRGSTSIFSLGWPSMDNLGDSAEPPSTPTKEAPEPAPAEAAPEEAAADEPDLDESTAVIGGGGGGGGEAMARAGSAKPMFAQTSVAPEPAAAPKPAALAPVTVVATSSRWRLQLAGAIAAGAIAIAVGALIVKRRSATAVSGPFTVRYAPEPDANFFEAMQKNYRKLIDR